MSDKSNQQSKISQGEKPPAVVMVTCPACGGSKIEELEGGFVQRRCQVCEGRGEIPESKAGEIQAEMQKIQAETLDARSKVQEALKMASVRTPEQLGAELDAVAKSNERAGQISATKKPVFSKVKSSR